MANSGLQGKTSGRVETPFYVINDTGFPKADLSQIETPFYVVDEALLEKNLRVLSYVKKKTGCKILLALKGFAMHSTFPLIRKYLDGICASSPHEAKLGREKFGKEVHAFAPAYSENDIRGLLKTCDHIVFNSFAQWKKFRKKLKGKVEASIRINPEYAEVETELYNPCAPNSRMGVTLKNFDETELQGISGLHFHALCEQNSDTLERVLEAAEKNFGKYFSKMKWINFGGGHHITRKDYDVEKLCKLIIDFKKKYGVQVILEPGEAVALNAGFLVSSVLDAINNGMDIAIMDTSAETHMPDTLAMPYRPYIIGSGNPGEKKYTYRLGGLTCLSGDVIGDYSFDKKLEVGTRLAFTDMAIYSMVKNTTFNGVQLPSIVLVKNGKAKVVKRFGYEDYKNRLS